jgi:S-adenosylmethionine:tRNA ribosyltransferase-isomerase
MSELDQYDFNLPKELIAQFPLRQRTDARLLVVQRRTRTIEHSHIRDLAEWIAPADCLVLNDTRVVPARLVGYREQTGGRWTGLFVAAEGANLWKVLAKTRGHMAPGETVVLQDAMGRDAARLTVVARLEEGHWLVRPPSDAPTYELLESVGRIPLPPYIRGGEMVESDRAAYQTVFAEKPGAVAAPTAGLHFTEELLSKLRQRGVGIVRVTLHVGPGTFRPIKVERLEEHVMHSEWGMIDSETVESLNGRRRAGGRIVVAGTTSLRVLETAARSGALQPWSGQTELFIRPPFEFHAADALLTNFHLPRSTLLVLVRTFGGDELIRRAYEEAVLQQYRFFSYGDAMLIL